jgi:hypothetical protein
LRENTYREQVLEENFRFGIKRDEVIGGWRNVHIEELHNFYLQPDIISVTNQGG